MSFDTFVGLPLDQSVQGATWDSGDVTWLNPSYLVGNGANAVKYGPGAGTIVANFLPPDGTTEVGVFFKTGTGRNTTVHAAFINMHCNGSVASQYGLDGVQARATAYGFMQCCDIASGATTEIAAAINDADQYYLAIVWLGGKDYRARLYAAANDVKGSLIAETAINTIPTARPASAKMAQVWGGGAPNITFSRFETVTPVADTDAPDLSAPTATATSSSTATGTVATDEAGGPLFSMVSANATETAPTIIASGASQTVTATGSQTVLKTGLTAGYTGRIHYVQKDAAGNTSNVVSSAPFTTPAPDSVQPTFAGGAAITPGAVTSSSVSGSYPAASDNVAVTGYQKSKDSGATWEDNGTGLNFTFTGLAASTTYPVWIRARDAAGNFSTPLQLSMATTAPAAGTTGSFTTEACVATGPGNGSLRANQAVSYSWFAGGVVGTSTGTPTHGTGTLSAGATLTAAGLPKGAGYLMMRFADGGIYYQEGTVV